MMPGMDGVETARLIRRIGTAYAKDIPIIALSSNTTTANEEMFIKKGFQAYLAKPVDVTLLNDVIKRWVRDDSRKGEIACADCLRREGAA
jgi:CheY-like chemotaxis protein